MTYTNIFPLPGPAGLLHLPLDLALLQSLEAETSLLETADRLAAREMKLSEMIALLQKAYAAAGAPAVEDCFLLQQNTPLLLAELLLAILSPLSQTGAMKPPPVTAAFLQDILQRFPDKTPAAKE